MRIGCGRCLYLSSFAYHSRNISYLRAVCKENSPPISFKGISISPHICLAEPPACTWAVRAQNHRVSFTRWAGGPMSLAAYLDRHGWEDVDPLALEADARGGGSPPRLRLSQLPSPRKRVTSLDRLGFPFAARLSHADVLFNEEYGVPVPPGSRALSPLSSASPSPIRLRSSEPSGSMRLSLCSPDFLRPGEALGSPLSSPTRRRSQSVGGSSSSGVRPPAPVSSRPQFSVVALSDDEDESPDSVTIDNLRLGHRKRASTADRPSAPTGLHDSLRLPSPRASRNLSPEIGTSEMSPSPSRESSFRKGDSVTQHGVTNALSSLGGVTAAASIASTLAKSLEQKLERKRQVLDKQLEEEALDWQQRQQPKPKFSLAGVKAAVRASMKLNQGLAGSKEAVSPGSLRSPPKGSPSAATTSSEQHSSDAERRATTHPSPPHSTSKWVSASEQLLRGRDAAEGPRLSVAMRATGALRAELRLRQRCREVQRLHDVYVDSEQRQWSSFEDILKVYYPSLTRTELLEMDSWTRKQAVVAKREYTLDELVEIRSMFEGLDKSRSGTLEMEKLVAAGWGGTTDDEHADLNRMFDEIDEDGDGSIDIEGFTRLVTECKLLDGDLAAAPPPAAAAVERTRTSRPAALTRRPSLAMLDSERVGTTRIGRPEQLRLEASSAAALVDSGESKNDSAFGES